MCYFSARHNRRRTKASSQSATYWRFVGRKVLIFGDFRLSSFSLRVMRFPAGGLRMLSCFHSAQCSKFTSLLSTFRSQWHFSETKKKEKQKRDFRCENPAHIRDDSDEYSRKYEEWNEHCRHGFSTPLKSGREFSHWISDPNVSLQD